MELGLSWKINFLLANAIISELANERLTQMLSLREFFETQSRWLSGAQIKDKGE
jgi:hypothetical protein